MLMEKPPSLADRFAHVDTWVFDLDNTLYSSDSDLWPQIDHKITLFLAMSSVMTGCRPVPGRNSTTSAMAHR